MKKSTYYILVVSLSTMSIMSIGLLYYSLKAQDDFASNIKVQSNKETIENFSFEDLSLNPGQEREYTIALVCEAEGTYLVSLDFDEKEDGGLKKYIQTSIYVDEVQIVDTKLSNLFDDNYVVEFYEQLYTADPVNITINYKMDIHADNEAQGAFSKFDMTLKVDHNK